MSPVRPVLTRRPARSSRTGTRAPTCATSRRSSRPCATSSAPTIPLLHDAHHRLTPIEAARLGRSLEPYDLFWLEDCTPAENQDALRLVREHTTTPLAIGEVFNTVFDYQTLVGEQLIDYVRSAVTHFGGVSPLRKLFDYAAQHNIKSAIHGPEDISPVGMAAAIHLDLAIHNFGIQEYSGYTDRTHEVFQHAFTFTDGHLHPGEAPVSASTSTRRWQPATPTSAPTSPSTASPTAPSTTGRPRTPTHHISWPWRVGVTLCERSWRRATGMKVGAGVVCGRAEGGE